MNAYDDIEEFREDEELAATQALPPNYEPDDFAYQDARDTPRHRRGKLLAFDLSLEQLRGHIDPTGERLGQIERLRKAWETVVGPSASAHTKNLFLRGTELIVWLDSNLYAQQLPLFSSEYCAGLERELGGKVVTSISYRLDHHRRRGR
ncbi:MAG: DUF721 domain-containing protein [Actinomycetia bacterium]|nr:DUF721 domain-containing protein [Actinomycetes bacterium]